MQLIIDFYKNLLRLGPGGEKETLQALSMLDLEELGLEKGILKIADIGCGTGATTLSLAKTLSKSKYAEGLGIVAVDFLEDFLQSLQLRAKTQGVDKYIQTLSADMQSLPFENDEFDIIWSEGAIYSMGFTAGIKAWHPFLKQNGLLVLSEITWTSAARPDKIQKYWDTAYTEMAMASEKIRTLEACGYSLLGYFLLPKHCWLDNYYNEVEKNFEAFLIANNHSDDAKKLVEEQVQERALYTEFSDHYGYGMYIAKKL